MEIKQNNNPKIYSGLPSNKGKERNLLIDIKFCFKEPPFVSQETISISFLLVIKHLNSK
jgi:hypothetical protein